MVLGIDLGTSNTVAATLSRDGSPVIVPDAYNKNETSTPSIALLDGKKAFIGQFAENLYEIYPQKSVVSHFKRNFGTQEPVYFDEKNNPWFSESIAALVLKKIKYDTEMYMPDGFTNSVITVPAHYNDVQRKSVIEAARLANFPLSAILEEPVAAALCYGNTANIEDEIILVYDFGGGTFDLTLITKSKNQLHVIAKDGVNKLGGKEFDEIVSNTIQNNFYFATKKAFPTDRLTQNRLKKVAEQIKIQLNDSDQPRDFTKWMMFGRDAFECKFNYEQYASAALQLIQKTDSAVSRCLRSLGMQLSDVNKFVLIGGTSSSKMVYNYWNQKMGPHQQLIYHQPLSSVAKGAALYANSLQQSEQSDIRPVELRSVSTYNIGLRLNQQTNIDLAIHRNTPLPVTAKKAYRINPNQQRSFQVQLCQFWDAAEDVHELGNIVINQLPLVNDLMIEIQIENRLNGTIGVKVKNGDNGQDIRFEFHKKNAQHKYDFQEQLDLVNQVFVNNYI